MLPPMFELVCALCQLGSALADPPASGVGESATRLFAGVQLAWATPGTSLLAPVATLPVYPGASLGEQWQLSGGRALSLNLTPTRERCAPLLEMTF
jgi:hypothetical protein